MEKKVADAADIAEGDRLVVELDGKEIAIFNFDGEFYAILNHCPHQGGPIGEGDIVGAITVEDDGWDLSYGEETNIECPWHSWQFDIKQGNCISDDTFSIPSYETVVKNGELYLEL